MNATKRKFNALLQGLNNPPPATTPDRPSSSRMTDDSRRGLTSFSSPSSYDTLLLKRRRLGLTEPNTPNNRSPSGASPFSNLKKTNSPPSRSAVDALVKYCPADRDELLKRLATFQELTNWTPKPDRVNEVQWARRGWVCHGKEKVRCLLCSKELLVTLNKRDVDGQQVPVLVSSEIEDDAVVDKYCELILTSHQQDCLWRKRGCDESLLRLSFSNDKAVLASLRQRYDELCTRAAFLPYQVNIRLPAEIDLDRVLSLLPPDFFADSAPSATTNNSVNRPALALALMGWEGLSHPRLGAVPNSASCHACLRRLGLWMFKSKEVADDGRVIVPAPMDHLDPLREHRFFCPWKSADAQSRGAGAAKAAWSMLLQTIVNDASLRGLYEGRPLTEAAKAGLPGTPKATAEKSSVVDSGNGDDEEDEKARDAKDKERWARLRKVKSLFDTKGAKILRRSVSINRPEAGQS
ncbi:hypothetical protein XA68_17555 [Ophiocordyceps unilateralis]|uniref:C3HC-type domain-containing protein n=1 Tax=Ophiocordyceps unilateralis TaxID=268505 RepID=A0A2A9PKF5_OPHUN|nr:hypothetical protein XA68_17555 [Ophiocordyceps unilateralis]